jgi:hypothetical protein
MSPFVGKATLHPATAWPDRMRNPVGAAPFFLIPQLLLQLRPPNQACGRAIQTTRSAPRDARSAIGSRQPQLCGFALAEGVRSHSLNAAAFVVGDAALFPQERKKVGKQRVVGELDLHCLCSQLPCARIRFAASEARYTFAAARTPHLHPEGLCAPATCVVARCLKRCGPHRGQRRNDETRKMTEPTSREEAIRNGVVVHRVAA